MWSSDGGGARDCGRGPRRAAPPTLGDEGERRRAADDLTGGLESLPHGAVVDEAQLVPHLQTGIKQIIDARGATPSQFLLATESHAAGLRRFRDRYRERVVRGHVPHSGDNATRFDDTIRALPFSALWTLGAPPT